MKPAVIQKSELTFHAGQLIRAYMAKVCPQAQARVFPHVHPSMGRVWGVTVLVNGSAPRELQGVFRSGNIKEYCENLLSMAEYKPQREDNGNIYYG